MYVEEFLKYLAYTRRLSAHTVAAYQNDLNQFTTFLAENEQIVQCHIITHLHIKTWLLQLNEQGVVPKTIHRKLSCLKSWFRFLQKNEYIAYNPMLKIVSPKLPRRLPSVVQEKQMEKLFDLIDFGTDFSGVRNKTILELLYGTGIRRSELIQLRLPDVMLDRRLLKVLGKGNKERLVPIPNYLVPQLKAYLQARAETFTTLQNPAFFLTDQGQTLYPKLVYNIVHKYLSLVSGGEQRSPHTLRHSYATHLSNQGADLNAIKSLLGHSSLASTQVYMHNSLSRLKAVYEQAHPKSKNTDEQS